MLLLWSGGCDSTALICDYYSKKPIWLKSGFFDTKKPLRTLAIVHPQILAANENRKARHEVVRRLKKRGFTLEHTEITLRLDGPASIVAQSFPQPYLWISLAIPYLEPDETLVTGWVRGDDVWHGKHEIGCMFDSAKAILEKTCSLQYPLEYVAKPEVIRYLKKQRMYSATWYCEFPINGRKCKSCVPCETHATALWQIATRNKKNEYV